MQAVTTIGFDIAKSVFQVHELMRTQGCRSSTVEAPIRAGILQEAFALPSGHRGLRHLTSLVAGTARPWPYRPLDAPAYVKPYLKRQKNDAADAEAICEAVARPNMRFVETKTAEQQSCLMLHRTRHLFVRQQNAVINSIWALG